MLRPVVWALTASCLVFSSTRVVSQSSVPAVEPVQAQADSIDESAPDELHRRVAVSLVEEVIALGFDGEYRAIPSQRETTLSLLSRAHMLDPDLADASFLLSQVTSDRREAARREQLLNEALRGDFALIERAVVVQVVAEWYLRQGRGREALRLIDEEFRRDGGVSPVMALIPAVNAPDVGPPRPATDAAPARLHYLYAEALLAVGPRWYAGEYLRRLYNRFPDDPEAARMWWTRHDRISLGFLEWLDAAERRDGGVSPAVYLHAARYAPMSLLGELTRRYYDAGGTDTLPAALTLLAGDRFFDPRSRYAATIDDRAIEAFFFSDKVIWEIAFRSANGERGALAPDAAVFADAIEGDSDAETILTVDDDRDLFWEERYTIRGGELVAWQTDRNRNGYVEAAVLFTPRGIRILIAEGGIYHVVEYASYPLVKSVIRTDGDETVVWTPSRPVAFDAGLRVVAGEAVIAPGRESAFPMWEILGGRVRLEGEVAQRFARQLGSDDARVAGDRERASTAALLSEWELMQ